MTADDHTEEDFQNSTDDVLQSHRSDIAALDRHILDLVRQRLDVADRIARWKSRTRTPLRNYEVEAEVHTRFADGCRDRGLDPSVGHDLATLLIQKSVEQQASLLDSTWDGEHLRCLVIGGKGGMGSWMTRFLQSQGHAVSVYDNDPTPTPAPTVADLGHAADDADLIIVAVPMSDCGAVLESLAERRVRAVVTEMCSFKGHLINQMEQFRRDGLRLVSIHPLFGPDTMMLSERTIVLCTEGRAFDRALVRRLFEDTSATLVELDAAEHDRTMAIVLGLTHLSNLAFARALSYSGIGIRALTSMAGVTFRKQILTTKEVCQENPTLYYQIQAFNPWTDQAAEWIVAAIGELTEAVSRGDASLFQDLMEDGRRFLDETTFPGESQKGKPRV